MVISILCVFRAEFIRLRMRLGLECSSDRAAATRAECHQFEQRFHDVSHISPSELKKMQERGRVVLVDVRSPDEFNVSTLPGAIRLEDLSLTTGTDMSAADAPVVCFCTVGFRSSLEARRLSRSLAPTAVHSMSGVLEWAHEGGSFVDPATGAPTQRLHLFGRHWAEMAPETEPPLEVVTFGSRCGEVAGFARASWRTARAWFLARGWRSATREVVIQDGLEPEQRAELARDSAALQRELDAFAGQSQGTS
jgi:rhodanese-related sulfurtransferase